MNNMLSYWEHSGNRSPDFWAGVKEGVTAYAIWKGNNQLVCGGVTSYATWNGNNLLPGCPERPLKEVLAEIDEVAERNRPPDHVLNKFMYVWGDVYQKCSEQVEKQGDSFQDVELNFLRAMLSEEFREVCTAGSDRTEYDEVVDLILVALMLGSRLRDELNKEVSDDGQRKG